MQSNDGRTNSSQQIQSAPPPFFALSLAIPLHLSHNPRPKEILKKSALIFEPGNLFLCPDMPWPDFFSQGAKCPVLTSNYGRSSTVHPICTSQVNAPRDAPFVSQSLNHLWGDSNQLHLCAPGKFNETVILWLATFSQRKCLTMHDILSAVRPFNVLSTRHISKSIPFNVYGNYSGILLDLHHPQFPAGWIQTAGPGRFLFVHQRSQQEFFGEETPCGIPASRSSTRRCLKICWNHFWSREVAWGST